MNRVRLIFNKPRCTIYTELLKNGWNDIPNVPLNPLLSTGIKPWTARKLKLDNFHGEKLSVDCLSVCFVIFRNFMFSRIFAGKFYAGKTIGVAKKRDFWEVRYWCCFLYAVLLRPLYKQVSDFSWVMVRGLPLLKPNCKVIKYECEN